MMWIFAVLVTLLYAPLLTAEATPFIFNAEIDSSQEWNPLKPLVLRPNSLNFYAAAIVYGMTLKFMNAHI